MFTVCVRFSFDSKFESIIFFHKFLNKNGIFFRRKLLGRGLKTSSRQLQNLSKIFLIFALKPNSIVAMIYLCVVLIQLTSIRFPFVFCRHFFQSNSVCTRCKYIDIHLYAMHTAFTVIRRDTHRWQYFRHFCHPIISFKLLTYERLPSRLLFAFILFRSFRSNLRTSCVVARLFGEILVTIPSN